MLWKQSKNKKTQNIPELDIAILPITKGPGTYNFRPLNISLAKNSARNDVIFEPTMPLHIVGYPIKQNISQLDDPSWVTTYVANPPQSDKFFFLTNGYPFSGMSGAPVFWVFPNRPIKLSNGGGITNATKGTFIQFAGIYSGRLYESSSIEKIVPIARIWKSELIETILSLEVIV